MGEGWTGLAGCPGGGNRALGGRNHKKKNDKIQDFNVFLYEIDPGEVEITKKKQQNIELCRFFLFLGVISTPPGSISVKETLKSCIFSLLILFV